MNRFMLRSMALASALFSPAASYAQISCTREGLQTATDLYIAAQTHGYATPKRPPIQESAAAPTRAISAVLPTGSAVHALA